MPNVASLDVDARVGKTIQRLREANGITQQRLAELCGITQASVSYIEGGKRAVKLNILDRVGVVLGIGLSRIISMAVGESIEERALLKETLDNIAEAEKDGGISLDEVERKVGVASKKGR